MKSMKTVLRLVQIFDPECSDAYAYVEGHCDLVKLICQKIVDVAEGVVYCPFCDKDLRPKHDCKNCDIDPFYCSKALCCHDGKHADDCLVLRAKQELERGEWTNPEHPDAKKYLTPERASQEIAGIMGRF